MTGYIETWRRRGEAARLAHEAVNRAFREHVRERDPDRYAAFLKDFWRRPLPRCRAALACGVWSDFLDEEVARRMQSPDPGVRRRATWVAEAAIRGARLDCFHQAREPVSAVPTTTSLRQRKATRRSICASCWETREIDEETDGGVKHDEIRVTVDKSTAFSCPHCGAYTTQYWYNACYESLDDRATPQIWRADDIDDILKHAPESGKISMEVLLNKLASGNPFFETKEDSEAGHYFVGASTMFISVDVLIAGKSQSGSTTG